MAIDLGPGRARLLEILFKDTTSFNGEREILQAFEQVATWPQASNTCAFYQGCGCDLITLACTAVDIHVLSDREASCGQRIGEKLEKLSDEGLIESLKQKENGWHFTLLDRQKSVCFVTDPVDRLHFRDLVGVPVGLVFEWNPVDSALIESFWDAVTQELEQGGFVIGSFDTRFEMFSRSAFLLNLDGAKPAVRVARDADDQGSFGRALSEFGLQLEHCGRLLCTLRRTGTGGSEHSAVGTDKQGA